MHRHKKISKWLSYHLRHRPQAIGLELQPGGWVPIDALLRAAWFSRKELVEVVAANDKQRFAIDAGADRIRANQGHSVDVDLVLQPRVPPAVLFHGTAQRVLAATPAEGLSRRNRHHVHLSAEVATARKVGQRHGRPCVLEVDAAAMAAAGQTFYCSANGVWLVDAVPPRYLRLHGK